MVEVVPQIAKLKVREGNKLLPKEKRERVVLKHDIPNKSPLPPPFPNSFQVRVTLSGLQGKQGYFSERTVSVALLGPALDECARSQSYTSRPSTKTDYRAGAFCFVVAHGV